MLVYRTVIYSSLNFQTGDPFEKCDIILARAAEAQNPFFNSLSMTSLTLSNL